MNWVLEFLINNKEWLFSGLGLSIIAVIAHLFRRSRNKTQNTTPALNQTINVQPQNLTVSDVKDIAELVFEKNFPKLQENAKQQAVFRKSEFIKTLLSEIQTKLAAHQIGSFSEPDIQYALAHSIVTAARRPDRKEHLSSLLVQRVQAHGREPEEIVYSRALEIVGYITAEQLDFLVFAFLLNFLSRQSIRNREDLMAYLKNKVEPFISNRFRDSLSNHLEALGCVTVSDRFGLGSLEGTIRHQQPEIFRRKIRAKFTAKQIQWKIRVAGNIRDELFEPIAESDKFAFRDQTVADFEERVDKFNLDRIRRYDIKDHYMKNYLDIDVAREYLSKHYLNHKTLQEQWRFIRGLQLTSVGIVIAASQYEQKIGEAISITDLIA